MNWPISLVTANGEVQTREEATVYVKELDSFLTMMLLEETFAVLSLGKLCEDHGKTCHWTNGQKPHLTKNSKRINCKKANCVPFVVPGLSTSSSTSTSPASSTSSSQHTVISTENPATERSEIMSEESGKSVEWIRRSRKHIKMKTTKNYEVNYCKICQNCYRISRRIRWIRMFNHVSTLPSSSHEFPMEPRAKVEPGPGKYCIKTHIPKDRNLRQLLENENYEGFLQKTYWYSRAQSGKIGDRITADHKVLSEGCESRNNHRYAVVVQDLATQWIQSYPCKTKTSEETQKSLQKFVEQTKKPQVIYTDNSLEFGKSCEELSWNHCAPTPHRSETNKTAERAVRRIEEGTSAVLLQSGLDEKMVGGFHGMLLLSAKHSRFLV